MAGYRHPGGRTCAVAAAYLLAGVFVANVTVRTVVWRLR